jgi:regulator of protease activity HflC (stomatin/prohibitin superfamily)
MFDIFGYAFLVVIVGIIVFSTFFTVEQQSVALIERFGAYRRTAHAGLSMKVPFIDNISYLISL